MLLPVYACPMHLNNNIEILLSDPAAMYVWLTLSVDQLNSWGVET